MANFNKCTSTSCQCGKCQFLKAPPKTGNPTNMSVRNCEFPKYYDCYNKNVFRSDIEPRNNKGHLILNPQLTTSKLAKDFVVNVCPVTGCNKSFTSNDPRLSRATHGGQSLTLDTPPLDSSVVLSDINTDETLRKYGQHYTNYSDINAGQITYYVNKERQDPFYEPVFSTPSSTVGVMYRDPMGAMKPQYERRAKNATQPCGDTDCYPDCLSWIEDSQTHREDLMASQMRKHNEQRYEPRWFGYKSR